MDERKKYNLKGISILVVTPLLTANAYAHPGFYDYYNGTCGIQCLTVEIKNTPYTLASNKNTIHAFELLNASMITDYDLLSDLTILNQYDRIVVLHNEYVTKELFEAIQNHSNVIYLHPNSLYAEVRVNDGKMTLIRGHNYPEPEIRNGFAWEFDNSPMEYDRKCENHYWVKINNGYQLSCYPEVSILKHKEIFDFIKNGGK